MTDKPHSPSEQEISNLVDRFYAKVREDAEIGPVFNRAVENWDEHLALLKDFWSTVLSASGRYKGNPLLVHGKLAIEAHHFKRWLQLFEETAVEVFSPVHAQIVVQKAKDIAVNLQRMLAIG